MNLYFPKWLLILFVIFALWLLWLCNAHAEAYIIDIEKELAMVLAAEGCSEGENGMIAILSVIKNRVTMWNKTEWQVISAKNQFYGFTASNKYVLYNQCKEMADRIVRNRGFIMDNTGGALYFRQPSEPIYSWHGEETVRIGNHIFHKERVKND